MIPYDFAYERARTLVEAAELLARFGPGARIMAGGTDLLPNMRAAITRPNTLVSLNGLVPDAPRIDADGTIRLGALTRLATLSESQLVRQHAPMLAEAAHAVGSNQIREMGTLGGNLCQDTRCLYLNQTHDFQFVESCYKRGGMCCYPFPNNKPEICWSVYMSDIAPALIALGAELEIVDPAGTRRMPIEDVYSGSGLRPFKLAGSEIIQAVLVPPQPRSFGWGFHKSARRGGLEFAIAVAAATLCLSAEGHCAQARIAIGAVREKPVRASAAERVLAGKIPDPDVIAAAAAKAAEEASPLPHHGFTKSFIVDNLRVYLRRVLARAVERARADVHTAQGARQ